MNGLRSIDWTPPPRNLIEVVCPESLKHSSMVNGGLSVIEAEITTMLPKFTADNWTYHSKLLMVKVELLDQTNISGSTIFNAKDLKNVLNCVRRRHSVTTVTVNIPKSIVLTLQNQLSIDCLKSNPLEMVIKDSFKQSKMVNGSLLVIMTQE
jgi:hypothetical protein